MPQSCKVLMVFIFAAAAYGRERSDRSLDSLEIITDES